MKRGLFVLMLSWCLFPVGFEAKAGAVVRSCVAPPGGLVSWWRGEDNTYDQTGFSTAVTGGAPSYAPGKVGRAFSFNGVDQYVYIPEPDYFWGGYGGFAIEGWIYPVSDQDGSVISFLSSYYLRLIPGGALRFVLTGSILDPLTNERIYGDHALNTSTNAVTLNSWNHVAAVYDSRAGVQRIYVNGLRIAEQSIAPIYIYSYPLAPVTMGADFAPRGFNGPYFYNFFAGRIDELSFYDFTSAPALTDADVAAIYQAGSAGKCGSGPVILTQPQGQSAGVGATVTLNTLAVGFPPFKYQWRRNGVDIKGATNSALVLKPVTFLHAGVYSVAVSDKYGTRLSEDAALTIIPAQRPRIIIQPENSWGGMGGIFGSWPATFSVTATGSGPLQYQWYHNFKPVMGATNSTLSITPTDYSEAGSYAVIVYNNVGWALSSKATMQVSDGWSGGGVITR